MKNRTKKVADRDKDEVLRRQCERGLSSRFSGRIPGGYKERLDRELSVIGKLGFSKQFLTLARIAAYIKQKGIRMGPGRGAAPASLVCWSLGVTHVDSVSHELLFERFLHPGTKSFPVVEMDVRPAGRERVLDYLK